MINTSPLGRLWEKPRSAPTPRDPCLVPGTGGVSSRTPLSLLIPGKYPQTRGVRFTWAQTRTDPLHVPYIFLIPVCGYFLLGGSTRVECSRHFAQLSLKPTATSRMMTFAVTESHSLLPSRRVKWKLCLRMRWERSE